MRNHVWLLTLSGLACILAIAPGCATDPQQAMCDPVQRQVELARTYHDYFDQAAANAIVRQATVFPYYFQPHTARLTELGEHQLSVLAAYLRDNPTDIRMARGMTSDQLYQARTQAVLAFLGGQQVNTGAVRVIDASPDGDGMASERVAAALAAEAEEPKEDDGAISIPIVRRGLDNASN